jgi:hypothetical protein
MKYKHWQLQIVSFCAFFVLSIFIFQSPAYPVPTRWEKVDFSLEQLLNSGWKMSEHSTNRAATAASPGVSATDVETFSFLLSKNGKYTICFMENPSPPVANAASCRKLN